MFINTGRWFQNELDELISGSADIRDTGERIAYISGHFLNTSYDDLTLSGSSGTPEEFVIDLQAVDCFTLIDYVEAMRVSASFDQFKDNLRRVRYSGGDVSFKSRNHFFTDWINNNSERLSDVTAIVGGRDTITSGKKLNVKDDGSCFIDGLGSIEREVRYIPSDALGDDLVSNLMTGDYVGIYSNVEGLDVSHVGIIIKDDHRVLLRHASSDKGKVIDENLLDYIKDRPGIVILRPKHSKG